MKTEKQVVEKVGEEEKSKKKVVSRSVAIALGIVCIILIASLSGVVVNYTLILQKTITERDNLQTWLNGNITNYQKQVNNLNNQIINLNSQISNFQNQITSLNSQISSLQAQIQTLKQSQNPTPKIETHTLYFQSFSSDWSTGNFIMNESTPNGECKSNDMWHHPNNFISSPLKQNFVISTITVTIYHQIMSADGSVLKVEIMLIDTIGQVQAIATKALQSIENSRATSTSVNFNPSINILKNERLYVRVTVTTVWAWDWYWGTSIYPSFVSYGGRSVGN